jgi:hypothetical protein
MSAPDHALHQSRKFFLRQQGRPHMSQKTDGSSACQIVS